VTEPEPTTAEIPLPVTGSIPIYREELDIPRTEKKQPTKLWVFLVIAGSILTAMTFPGQTAGLSPFTNPLIDSLDIDRTAISFSYLIATLMGAMAMPFLGKAMDKYGAKRAIVVIGVLLALVLLAASFITEVIGLTASYVGLRMTGQGALSLAVTTLVARSITERPGLALGIVGAVGSAGISLAPLAVEQLIQWTDISTAWRIEALIVAVVVWPLALALPKDKPKTTTLTGSIIVPDVEVGYEAAAALRTPMFWVLSSAIFIIGMFSTAFAFHLISILGEQGLGSVEAAANFVPQTITGIIATLSFGAIVDKTDPRWGVVVSMVGVATAMLMLPLVEPGFMGILFGLVLGIGIGSLKGVEAAAYLRFYGRAHLGAIRGIATSIGLFSTALGPLYFAIGLDLTGSYVGPSMLAALAPLTVIIFALLVKIPPAPETLVK
jgi:MFS family permease